MLSACHSRFNVICINVCYCMYLYCFVVEQINWWWWWWHLFVWLLPYWWIRCFYVTVFNLCFISKVLTMVKTEGFIIIIQCKRLFMRRCKLVAAKCEAAIWNIGLLHWWPIFSGDFVGGDFRSGVLRRPPFTPANFLLFNCDLSIYNKRICYVV